MPVQTLITYSYLNDISGGDMDFQRDIVITFLEEMVGEMDRMRQALAKEDWETLGNVAHKMKAPIGMICVEVMRGLVLKIENNSKDQVDLTFMPADVQQFLDYLELAMQQLRADL